MKKLPRNLKPYSAQQLMEMKSEFEGNLTQIKITLEKNKTNPHPDKTWATRAAQAASHMGREIQRICTEQYKRKKDTSQLDELAKDEFIKLVFEEFEEGEAQEMMREAYEIARKKLELNSL
jgi:hypothetical protein